MGLREVGNISWPQIRNPNIEIRNKHEIRNSNDGNGSHRSAPAFPAAFANSCFCHSDFCHSNLFRISCFGFRISASYCAPGSCKSIWASRAQPVAASKRLCLFYKDSLCGSPAGTLASDETRYCCLLTRRGRPFAAARIIDS